MNRGSKIKSIIICEGCATVKRGEDVVEKPCCPNTRYVDVKEGTRVMLLGEDNIPFHAQVMGFQSKEQAKDYWIITDKGVFSSNAFLRIDKQMDLEDMIKEVEEELLTPTKMPCQQSRRRPKQVVKRLKH